MAAVRENSPVRGRIFDEMEVYVGPAGEAEDVTIVKIGAVQVTVAWDIFVDAEGYDVVRELKEVQAAYDSRKNMPGRRRRIHRDSSGGIALHHRHGGGEGG